MYYTHKVVPYKGSFAIKENNKLFKGFDNQVHLFDTEIEAKEFITNRKQILSIGL